MSIVRRPLCAALPLMLLVGCASPYRSDRGALVGGLGGAGLGAIIGNQTKHPGGAAAGAAIGAAAGALTGAVVGNELDEIEASNRAMIEQQLGQRIRAGAVTMDDVVSMSQAGVGDDPIVTHIRAHGVSAPLTAQDIIRLKQSGVSDRVIQAMQAPPMIAAPPLPPPGPPAVIVAEPYYPWWRPWPRYHWGYRRRPGWNVGFSFGN